MKLIYAFAFVGLFACNQESSSDFAVVEEFEGFKSELGRSSLSSLEDSMIDQQEAADYVQNNSSPETGAQHEAKIIKTANLLFETQDLDNTHTRAIRLATTHGGFIQRDNAGKSYNRVYTQMVLRVPTQNFQVLIDSLGKGVAFFDQKDITRSDVGEEFVDLQARLKTKRELERRYLELLTKAKNVSEMLEIERELANIREEIEAGQGRLNYLQDKVSLSTINVEFYTTTAETGATVSYGKKMSNALKGGWNGISSFFLGVLAAWPGVLVLGIIVYLLRRYFKRRSIRFPQGGDQ